MPLNQPVSRIVFGKIQLDILIHLFLERRKCCIARKKAAERTFCIHEDFLACFGSAFINPSVLRFRFELVIYIFIKVVGCHEIRLIAVEQSPPIHSVQTLICFKIFIVNPTANTDTAPNFARLFIGRLNLCFISVFQTLPTSKNHTKT